MFMITFSYKDFVFNTRDRGVTVLNHLACEDITLKGQNFVKKERMVINLVVLWQGKWQRRPSWDHIPYRVRYQKREADKPKNHHEICSSPHLLYNSFINNTTACFVCGLYLGPKIKQRSTVGGYADLCGRWILHHASLNYIFIHLLIINNLSFESPINSIYINFTPLIWRYIYRLS